MAGAEKLLHVRLRETALPDSKQGASTTKGKEFGEHDQGPEKGPSSRWKFNIRELRHAKSVKKRWTVQ